jgi:hypothetical protein
MGKDARLKKERKQARKEGGEIPVSGGREYPFVNPTDAKRETLTYLPSPGWGTLLFYVLLLSLLTFATSIFPIESEDIFSNIVTGQYLWTHKSIPEMDPFSFTGPHRWIVNRAFPSIVFYAVHAFGGLSAIQIFCASLLAVTYAIVFVVWARRTCRPTLTFGVVALVILASCYWAQTRIYVFAYLYTVIALLLITSSNPRAVWWMIPLQVLWINSHPSAILGVFLVGVWFLVTVLKGRGSWKVSAPLVVLVTAANVVSPIGLRAFSKFTDELLSPHPSRTNIFEWFSPFSQTVSEQHLAWWFYGSCVLFGLVLAWQFVASPRVRSGDILNPLSLAFFILAAGTARHIPLFYFAFGSLLICVGEVVFPARSHVLTPRKRAWLHGGALVITLMVVAKVVVYGYSNGNVTRHFGLGIDTHKFPDEAIDIIKKGKIEGNVFADYDTGAYFLYRMYPDYKVYIDGARLDEVYGEEGFLRYMRLGNDQQVINEEITKYDIRAFLIPLPPTKGEIVQLHKFLSADPRWGLAYFDDSTMLFILRDEAARRGVPLLTYLTPFSGADEIIKNRANGFAVLERDFEVGESINPNSVAFLTMKTRFLKTVGQTDKATQTAKRMVSLCKEIDPTELCRANARRQLMAMGRYDLARELEY